jgi:biopolymer transport protein ExbB/TolQ
MSISIILDLLVIAMLAATIVYAVALNHKLSSIYQNRGELQQFLTTFTTSLAKAEESMRLLKGSGETAFSMVQEHMQRATALRDDLSFLVERGDAIATKLDDTIREARNHQKDLEVASKKFTERKSIEVIPSNTSSSAEPDLIQSLRNVR